MSQDRSKRNAAEEAVRFVKHGMVVGLGTGSTAKIAVDLIGKKLSKDFKIKGMPTSIKTKLQAEKLGIELINIDDYDVIDLMVISISFASKTTLIGPKDDSSASSHIAIVSTNAACLFR